MVDKVTEIGSVTGERISPKSNFLKAVSAVVWKDLRAELRSRELFSAMLVFAALMIIIFQ